jgi:hypothetical protein
MSKKERRKQKQKEREEKLLEQIRSGKAIRVFYEERKKKPSLPNRKCQLETPEQELKERQETVEKATMVYRQMMPGLLQKLNRIRDIRKPGKVKHKLTVLMAYGILLFVYQIGSRRNANRTISCPVFFQNLQGMFPELETLPHADTLARLLEGIEVEQIQDCMIELLKDLIRRKKFKNYLLRKQYLVAVDGTQKFFRGYRWEEECLERHVGGDSKIPQYYVYVLDAVLVLDNGIVLPVISEILENKEYKDGESKQDCERKAFLRLAEKLKRIFRGKRLALVLDGLYACGPIMKTCKQNGWDYMIVLKEDALPHVWHEATGLMRIDPENSLKVMWGERTQVYHWANEIIHEYGRNGCSKIECHVVICHEIWKEQRVRSTKVEEEMHTRYAWISSKKLDKKNVFYRCTKIARYRWRIENNILVEKHQGYENEHCYSYCWNAMKGFHYLMKIGHFLNALALNSELLIDKVNELGIRGFINYLRLACSGTVLDIGRIAEIVNSKHIWKIRAAS